MKIPRLRPTLFVAALLGAAIPTYSELRYFFWDHMIGREVYLWPSAIFLLATDGAEHSPSAYVILAISIVANMLLYALIALVLWILVWVVLQLVHQKV